MSVDMHAVATDCRGVLLSPLTKKNAALSCVSNTQRRRPRCRSFLLSPATYTQIPTRMPKKAGSKRRKPDDADMASASADASAASSSPLSEFEPGEVIKEEASFRVVEGQLKGVRTLLKVKRQEAEVPLPAESSLPWTLQSESGAEYSYYTAHTTAVVATDYSVEVISPASDAKVDRERPQKTAYFEESAALYTSVSQPIIEAQLAKDEAKIKAKLGEGVAIQSKIGWLVSLRTLTRPSALSRNFSLIGLYGSQHNVLCGAKETERVLHDDDMFLMNVDTKWATHPDCNTTPRAVRLHRHALSTLRCA